MFNEDTTYEGLSICVVQKDDWSNDNGVKLKRWKDIDNNQVVDAVFEKELEPRKPLIVYSNEVNKSFEKGFVGVWQWHAEPNSKAYFKTFTLGKYDSEVELTEVKRFNDVGSMEQLKEKIKKENFQERQCACNILYLYPQKDYFEGLFVRKEQLVKGKYKIREDIFSLEKCSLEKNVLDNNVTGIDGKFFYKKTNLSFLKDTSLEPFRNPNEVIKDELSNYYSNSIRSQIGLSRKELQKFKNIINDIPTRTISESLETKLQLEKSSIDSILVKFIENSKKFISSEDIPSEVIYKIVNSRDDYHDKALDIYGKIWSAENQKKIETSQKKLSVLQKEIETNSIENKSVTDTLKLNRESLEAIKIKIEQNKKIGQDVEKKTKEKINEVQKNAADFIANLPFLNLNAQKASSDNEKKEEKNYYSYGKKCSNLNVLNNLSDALESLEDNLDFFGFKEPSKLAIYLFSVLKEKIPLLITGPFGEQLIDILSVSLTGKHVGVLNCCDDLDLSVIEKINSGEDQIVVIKNIFNSKWINYLPELVNNTDKYVVVLHPFTEDLLIEPKGIFNYVQPLVTELFINGGTGEDIDIDTDVVAGLVNTDVLESYGSPKATILPFTKKFVRGSLARAHIIKSLSTYHSLAKDEDKYYAELVYGCASYALLTNNKEELKDYYQNTENVDDQIKEQLDELLS